MNGSKTLSTAALAMALGLAAMLDAGAVSPPTYPGDSIYLLKVALTDQHGTPVALDRYAGHPTVVSMFYGSCPHICPMLVASTARLQRELPEAQRDRMKVLFVSFDPGDTPALLGEVLEKQGIDSKGWTLARTSADEVRLVAATLGIRYKQLPDGSFSHATILTLLDPQGRPLARTERFTDPEPEFRAALAAATAR